MQNALRIAVADSHAEYREALSGLLTEYGFTVILTVPADPVLLLLIDPGNLPDILIISCTTIYPESIALIRELKTSFPRMKILANVVFIHYLPETGLIKELVDGVMVKTAAEPAAIVKAIHKACGLL